MADYDNTYYVYEADGVTTQYAINFKYIAASDVLVTVDAAPVQFSIANGFAVINPAPAEGAEVVVRRSTNAKEPLHVFQHGSPLLPRPLDENFRQTLYAVEEAAQQSTEADVKSTEALTRAEQAEQLAVQAAQDAAQAAQDADLAAALVQQADLDATQARLDAANALSTAGTAFDVANSASQTAGQASQSANYAVGVAEGIDQKAQGALDLSTNAIQRVEVVEGIVDDIAAGGVANFNGRAGAVVPEADDYDIQMITGLEAALQAKADVSDLDVLPELTKAQVEDADSDTVGAVSGRRLSEAVLKHSPPVEFGTIAGTAAEGNDPRLEGNVKTTGAQTIEGVKTYSSLPVLPSINPTAVNQAVRKGYVDSQIATRMPSSYLEQTLSNSAVKVPSSAAVYSAIQGNATSQVRVQAYTTYGGTQKLTTPSYDWRNVGVVLWIGDVFRITTPGGATHFRDQLFTLEGLSSDGKTLTFNAMQTSSVSRHRQHIETFSGGVTLLFERVCTGFEAHPTLGRSLVDARDVVHSSTSPRVYYPVSDNRHYTRLGARAEQFSTWISGSTIGVYIDGSAYLYPRGANRFVTVTVPAGSSLHFSGTVSSSNVEDFWTYA